MTFLLFTGTEQPAGGFHDYSGSFDDLEIAKAHGLEELAKGNNWFHVACSVTYEILYEEDA